ncbi:X-ray repair cross-complementing protein 5 [Halyomorpha halys]|uniref:X-ray repair cross-complementing protein 5 n=1 Tax=Halyomorpha halys TaxID=286706 RepID=UPI0006D4CB47|nr:X-ray repair cross-complementing protein 5-like [Halyomorpha halys]
MGTNKVATVVLFDVSQMMASGTDNGETFFERSLNCFKRMILRKIFSQDFDDMGVVLFGSDSTNNNLANGGSSCYKNIDEFSPLSLTDWNLYEKIENLTMSSVPKSNWVQGLVVAQDFMKNQTQGRKYRTKQLVVFCNLNSEISLYVEAVNPIVKALESENVNLIVIGNDIADDCEGKELDSQISGSLRLMFQCITNLKDAVQFSFSDIEKDLKYYENKRKMVRFYSISLKIGSQIQLPVRWMKVNKEATRFKWEVPPENVIFDNRHQQQQKMDSKTKWEAPPQQQKMDETKIEFETDTVKHTNFGGTIVDLGYADLEALKRNSGSPSLIYLGSVKSGRISRSMFVGKDQYVIIADKSARAVAMFSAFVDALLKAKKYGLARRVASKNGKIVVGALLPVSDEFGKALYFLKLPYSEYVQRIPMVHLPVSNNTEAKQAINDLIDNAMLPDDLLEEDKGILLRDPTFQSRCHALYLRATGKLPPKSIIPLPETVQQIINPAPFSDKANEALKRIAEIFPFTEPEEKEESPKKKFNKVQQPKTGSSHIDYKYLAKGNLDRNPALEYTKSITVNNKQEINEIMNLVNTEYNDVFSEEMFK